MGAEKIKVFHPGDVFDGTPFIFYYINSICYIMAQLVFERIVIYIRSGLIRNTKYWEYSRLFNPLTFYLRRFDKIRNILD